MFVSMENPSPKLKSLFNEEEFAQIHSIFSMFMLSDEQVQKIKDVTEQNMQYGCSKDANIRKTTALLMENTFIRQNLTGNENGTYLGLDLGGTNLRVFRVKFVNGKADTSLKYFKIPAECFTGSCLMIFEYMADCIAEFLTSDDLNGQGTLPLGFTFSFPSEKKSLTHVELINWTKTFKCSDGPGMDQGQMLMDCMKKRDLPVELVAIISDTTAALVTGNYLDNQCSIGLILGTGSNVCYIENIDAIEKWEDDGDKSKQVMINVEWGGLSDTGCLDFIRNKYDYNVDRFSNHVKSFTFEKLFSGLYLGELVRQVLVDLANNGILFNSKASGDLFTPWAFETTYVTNIERDNDDDEKNTMNALKDIDLESVSSERDIKLIRHVCSLLSQRAAYVVAAALSALVDRVNRPDVTIAVDGSTYEKHPKYHDYMMNVIEKLSPKTKTNIVLVKDSSVQGCAFAAALVKQK